MDTEDGSRWAVTYRLADDEEELPPLICVADDLVGALKQAQMRLRDALAGKAFRITAISES